MARNVASPPLETPRLDAVDVAILAGGLGTRVRPALGDLPKVLAAVGGIPFLAHLLAFLRLQGARRVVLCLGYRADRVERYLEEQPAVALEVITVREVSPLGTAGALRLARASFRPGPVIVVNGDTFLDADLHALLGAHTRAAPLVTMACVEVDDASRYGRVERDDAGFIARFIEKDPTSAGPGLINAGYYVLSLAALDLISASKAASLERDILHGLPPRSIWPYVCRGAFIDIGTPQSLVAAAAVIVPRSGA
jgi:NDP-sugar pyrophosphorylase family protein